MQTTKFKDLPLSYNKEYVMTIKKLYNASIVVSIDKNRFYIPIPRNYSWIHKPVYKDMVCIVKKEKYFSGEREFAKLTLVEVIHDNYYEKDNNYKETTTYESSSNYYEILKCSRDSDLTIIKQNYKKLIRQYHYDTLISKDLPKDMLEFAQNRAKQINEAYEYLKKVS